MTYLHYIWYGPVPADPSKYATANNMALACPEQRVLFWCKREYLDGFRAVLDPRIQVLPCDELDALAGQAFASIAHFAGDADRELGAAAPRVGRRDDAEAQVRTALQQESQITCQSHALSSKILDARLIEDIQRSA